MMMIDDHDDHYHDDHDENLYPNTAYFLVLVKTSTRDDERGQKIQHGKNFLHSSREMMLLGQAS